MKMFVRERTKCVAPFQCSNHSVTQKKSTVYTRHTREALFPFSLIKKLRHRGVNSWPRLGEAEPGPEGHISEPLPAGADRCAVLLRDGLQKGGGPRLAAHLLIVLTDPGEGPWGDFRILDIPKGRGEGGLGWGQTFWFRFRKCPHSAFPLGAQLEARHPGSGLAPSPLCCGASRSSLPP